MSKFARLGCLLPLALAALPLHAQNTRLRGFVDVTASTSDTPGESSSFGLGQYDFYLTSQVSDKISFLGESVFEYDDGFVVDVERIILTFAVSPYFRIAAGKHHTPLGYWNNAYHHGTLLQPTIFRPTMFRFEDEGGVLPIHTTGILFAGRDISRLHLGYDVMIGNGIGSTPTADNNRAKSVTGALHAQVTSDLRIGASLYLDRIAAGTPGLAGTPVVEPLRQRMFGGFAVYLSPTLELMGEVQDIQNRATGGSATSTDAFSLYGGYRFGKLVPYARYDEIRYPAADPYFPADDVRLGLIGARYDLSSLAVIKVELQRQRLASAGTSTRVVAQAAIGF